MLLLTNPLANPLFVPFAMLLLALLGGAAGMLFAVQQLHLVHDWFLRLATFKEKSS